MTGHLLTTPATARTCPHCKAHLLTAHDQGIPAIVDATPITPGDELTALLEGRWTYNHIYGLLIHRDAARIAAGHQSEPIHAQHKCPVITNRIQQQTAEQTERRQRTAALRTQLAQARTAGKAARHARRLTQERPHQ